MGAVLVTFTVNLHHPRKEEQMRKVLSVALLVVVLAGSARAGVLVGDRVPPPPGDAHTSDLHGGDLQPGDMPTVDAPSPGDILVGGDIHTGAAATFVQVVLHLLALS